MKNIKPVKIFCGKSNDHINGDLQAMGISFLVQVRVTERLSRRVNMHLYRSTILYKIKEKMNGENLF